MAEAVMVLAACPTVALALLVQPLASVTVTEYVPAASALISLHGDGDVPGSREASTCMAEAVMVLAACPTVALAVLVQPLASVTVTEYVPAASELISFDVEVNVPGPLH